MVSPVLGGRDYRPNNNNESQNKSRAPGGMYPASPFPVFRNTNHFYHPSMIVNHLHNVTNTSTSTGVSNYSYYYQVSGAASNSNRGKHVVPEVHDDHENVGESSSNRHPTQNAVSNRTSEPNTIPHSPTAPTRFSSSIKSPMVAVVSPNRTTVTKSESKPSPSLVHTDEVSKEKTKNSDNCKSDKVPKRPKKDSTKKDKIEDVDDIGPSDNDPALEQIKREYMTAAGYQANGDGKVVSKEDTKVRPKDESMQPPKRPLSAYNLFFHLERRRILALNCDSDDFEGFLQKQKLPPFTIREVAVFARQHRIESDRPKPKRKHRKTHGKISFTELARTIAHRWKCMTPPQRAVFTGYFSVEMNRYKNLLDIYNEQQDEMNKMNKMHITPHSAGSSPVATNEHQELETTTKSGFGYHPYHCGNIVPSTPSNIDTSKRTNVSHEYKSVKMIENEPKGEICQHYFAHRDSILWNNNNNRYINGYENAECGYATVPNALRDALLLQHQSRFSPPPRRIPLDYQTTPSLSPSSPHSQSKERLTSPIMDRMKMASIHRLAMIRRQNSLMASRIDLERYNKEMHHYQKSQLPNRPHQYVTSNNENSIAGARDHQSFGESTENINVLNIQNKDKYPVMEKNMTTSQPCFHPRNSSSSTSHKLDNYKKQRLDRQQGTSSETSPAVHKRAIGTGSENVQVGRDYESHAVENDDQADDNLWNRSIGPNPKMIHSRRNALSLRYDCATHRNSRYTASDGRFRPPSPVKTGRNTFWNDTSNRRYKELGVSGKEEANQAKYESNRSSPHFERPFYSERRNQTTLETQDMLCRKDSNDFMASSFDRESSTDNSNSALDFGVYPKLPRYSRGKNDSVNEITRFNNPIDDIDQMSIGNLIDVDEDLDYCEQYFS